MAKVNGVKNVVGVRYKNNLLQIRLQNVTKMGVELLKLCKLY